VAERYEPGDLVVLLGTPTADSSRLYAMTVTQGDPAWAGALAGLALGLPVYHITEAPAKAAIPAAAYEEHVALMEMALDCAEIARAVEAARAGR
jgi:glycine/sarcosine/betaine reductase complex component A